MAVSMKRFIGQIIAESITAEIELVTSLHPGEKLIVESQRYEGLFKFILLEEGVYAQFFIASQSDKILRPV